MLARWPRLVRRLPTWPCRACSVQRMKRMSYYTESFQTDVPGLTKMEVYGDSGQFRFDMDIHNYHAQDNDSPLVIHLPAISFEMVKHRLKDPNRRTHVPTQLQHSLGRALRVVQMNYRWSLDNPFPKPLHDMMFGYDAIVRNFCSRKTKVGVYGKYLGGTLATSLALTECDPRKTGHISTLAISCAPLDFATLAADDIAPENFPYISRIENDRERINAVKSVLKDQKLMHTLLFSSPAACFDPFVSPILFFRNAGREIPEKFAEPIKSYEAFDQASNPKPQKGIRTPPVRFPPKGSGLVLPTTLIQTVKLGSEDYQGRELAKLMRRSVIAYEMKENGDRDFSAEEEAENRVQYTLDMNSVGVTTGVRKEKEAKEGRIISWLENAMNN